MYASHMSDRLLKVSSGLKFHFPLSRSKTVEINQKHSLRGRETYGGQAEERDGGISEETFPKNKYTHTLSELDNKTHQGPSRVVSEGQKHEMAHKKLLTCDQQASVDIGTAFSRLTSACMPGIDWYSKTESSDRAARAS